MIKNYREILKGNLMIEEHAYEFLIIKNDNKKFVFTIYH